MGLMAVPRQRGLCTPPPGFSEDPAFAVRSHIWFRLRPALQLRSALFRIDPESETVAALRSQLPNQRRPFGWGHRAEDGNFVLYLYTTFLRGPVCGDVFERWQPATQGLFWEQRIALLHAALIGGRTLYRLQASLFFLFCKFLTYLSLLTLWASLHVSEMILSRWTPLHVFACFTNTAAVKKESPLKMSLGFDVLFFFSSHFNLCALVCWLRKV